MKKLGAYNFAILSEAIKSVGSYDPQEIGFYPSMENLLVKEGKEVMSFLQWVHDNKKAFGSGNYEQVFSEYKANA